MDLEDISLIDFSIEERSRLILNIQNKTYLEKLRSEKIGLAPAGEHSKRLVKFLGLKDYRYFDENTKLLDEKTFDFRDVAKLRQMDKILITSLKYSNEIEKKLLSLNIDSKKIINLGKKNIFENESFFTKDFLEVIPLTQDFIKKIEKYIAQSNKILFIYGPYFYDIYEKIEILQKYDENIKVFWNNLDAREITFEQIKNKKFVQLNSIPYMYQIIKRFNLEQKSIMMSVHPISYYRVPFLFKTLFPKLKVISYVYDWLNLFCPYKNKDLYQKYLSLTQSEVEKEYEALDKIINGDSIEGIIYKDGGKDFHLLKDFNKPKLFFPTYKSSELYVKANESRDKNKIVFIGSLFSGKTYLPELFSDAILFDVFQKVAKQGLFIDAYYAKNSDVVAKEYQNYFKQYTNVNIIKGDVLDRLFAKIQGKYHWGWMIYDDEYKVVKEHIKIILPSKVFTYMALGVPIIVINDFEYTAKFVKKYNIGIVIEKQNIDSLSQILKSVDYEKLVSNIKRVRDEFCLEANEDKFISFMKIFFE